MDVFLEHIVHINYAIYIPTDSIWPEQYTGMNHSQVCMCINAKKRFEKTTGETRIYIDKQANVTAKL